MTHYLSHCMFYWLWKKKPKDTGQNKPHSCQLEPVICFTDLYSSMDLYALHRFWAYSLKASSILFLFSIQKTLLNNLLAVQSLSRVWSSLIRPKIASHTIVVKTAEELLDVRAFSEEPSKAPMFLINIFSGRIYIMTLLKDSLGLANRLICFWSFL